MVDRINGSVQTGFWFSQDVRVLQINVGAGTPDFVNDVTNEVVNSELEQVLEIVAQYGTIIAVNPTAAGVVHIMLDYANALTAGLDETAAVGVPERDIADAVDAITDLDTITLDTYDGFSGVALGA